LSSASQPFFQFLTAGLMAFASIFSHNQPTMVEAPHFVTLLMLAFSVFYAALAVWVILTVIGILRLRSWARYSILIIGGGLAGIGVFGAFAMLVSRETLPTIQAQQPTADPRILTIAFAVMIAMALLVAAVGVWWLIYFTRRPSATCSNPLRRSRPTI
jgi:hypothetical protein